MTEHRHRTTRALFAAGLLCAAALGAACGDNGDNGTDDAAPSPVTPSVTMPSPETTGEAPAVDEITPEAAAQLCDMMRADIDTWKDQGATVAKVTFNGTVHNWAAREGGLNDTIIRDKTVVDTATEQQCPDVRQQALDALEVPDLASALAGFN